MSKPKSVAIDYAASDRLVANPAPQWAIAHLKDMLQRKGVGVGPADQGWQVNIASADSDTSGVEVPAGAESFVLIRDENTVTAVGRDARGLVYALTELADRVSRSGDDPFEGAFPLVGTPKTRTRSIMRLFVNEKEDKAWFHDKSHWIDYLTMLATNRFNRFSLTLGIQYDYPYHDYMISDVYLHFPYPYLVNLPNYDIKVLELTEAERETNLEMLKFIGAEAAKRGLEFQLGLWTQRYDFDKAPGANYTIVGVTEDNLAPYVRDALSTLLKEVPEITGLTFRIHVEGGIAEGDYDFWRVAFDGIKSAGRPIEIDMHAKGLDESTLNVALETGMPVSASPKYLAEHIGLSYHPSVIREREYPPQHEVTNREKLSVGARRFLRQSYGDLLPKDKKWRVLFRVWPGTQRVLAWGDPELAAGYGRSASFCGADGIEWMEPLSMKGRQGSGTPGGRALYQDSRLTLRLDWQKYVYQYRLWGRLSYDPDADISDAGDYLADQCGDAADLVAAALAASSKILPLVTQTHGPSVANNIYWPEIYTNIAAIGDNHHRPFGFDMEGPLRFGNAPTFDSQMFANAREFIEGIVSGDPVRRYSPLDVADWLSAAADKVEIAAVKAKACADINLPSVQRLLIDAQVAAAIGRFFAGKQRSACWVELYLQTFSRTARLKAVDHLRSARAAWKQAVDLTKDLYDNDLTFGPGPHMRGAWVTRLADIDNELKDLNSYNERREAVLHGEDLKTEHLLENWQLAHRDHVALAGPATFKRDSEIKVSVPAPGAEKVRLHYRQVNQAERWKHVDMTVSGGKAEGAIPAEYTDSAFHLQYYVTLLKDNRVQVVPGFGPSLAEQPYAVMTQG
ncbi:hypothetical protein [Devosia nitrariae]|uniref:Uncharacterized protein n=1 Tax=Devosia nitrariae TaxID=2071872 RepID=A0ABQ5W966_9HYPH|nr:hypothetical protein [Devosia nitrariae]GLQ56176.1 hypothetical protein GCM10010862_34350 [Devosia nitrariae]